MLSPPLLTLVELIMGFVSSSSKKKLYLMINDN